MTSDRKPGPGVTSGNRWSAWVLAGWVAALAATLCGCSTPAPGVACQVQELGVITDVLPLAVQPDHTRWRALRTGLTEAEVTALLGNPYRKDPRPAADTNSAVIHLYAWDYGEICFASFNTKGSFRYTVTFHEGRVHEVSDPWEGRFSPDGRPTVPVLLLPQAGQTLDHYPRFLDFRWEPASGTYPIEYEIVVEALAVDQAEAEHFEDYVREAVDANRASGRVSGRDGKELDVDAAALGEHLRRWRGVVETFRYRTHDIYLPLTWVGANTGRWHVRATNGLGMSDWTEWRYFRFSR